MHALLKTTVEEPILPIYLDNDQKTIPVSDPEISSDLKRKLLYKHIQSFDWEHGGLISPIKFLDRDSVEYSLLQAANHDQTESRMARLSLSRSFSLLDPVWGHLDGRSRTRDLPRRPSPTPSRSRDHRSPRPRRSLLPHLHRSCRPSPLHVMGRTAGQAFCVSSTNQL